LDLSTGSIDNWGSIVSCTYLKSYLTSIGAPSTVLTRVQFNAGQREPLSFLAGDVVIFQNDSGTAGHAMFAIAGDATHYATLAAHTINTDSTKIADVFNSTYPLDLAFTHCTFYDLSNVGRSVPNSTAFNVADSVKVTALPTNLNMRKGPGVGYDSVTSFPYGTILTVQQNSQNGTAYNGYYWWYVSSSGGTYTNWCAEAYLQKVQVADTTTPTINSFSVTPSSVILGGSFTISYTVSDAGGSGLKQVELWRSDGDGLESDPKWQQVQTNGHSGNGPVGGSFQDAPPYVGTYWYGLHVLDNASPLSNITTERQAGLGPLQRVVNPTSYTLTVNSSGASGVSISSSTGHGGTTNYTKTVLSGTSVTLTAPSTASGQTFTGWTGDVPSGSQTISFSMNGPKTVTANYATSNYTLEVNSSGTSGVSISSSTGHGGTTNYTKTVTSGTSVNLCAPHYIGSCSSRMRFNGWTGSLSSSTRCITFSMDGNKTVTANYVADPETYTLTVNSSGASSVSISSSTGHGGTTNYTKTVTCGTTVTLTAPSTAGGNNFQKWQRDGTDYSTSLTATVTMDTDYTMTALYVIAQTRIPVELVGHWDGAYWAEGVAVSGSYAYVADASTGLHVINISNPASPVRVGGYDGDAWDVAIRGRYAYVANGGAGLVVIDISNPANPVYVGGCNTSGYARALALAGSYAYVADGDAGLVVIDISNPAAPFRVGGCSTSDLSMDVAVSGNYAYVAVSSAGLAVIDISNPYAPRRVGGYDTSDSASGVAVSGRYAYLGDYGEGLQVIDISDPTAPFCVGGYNTPDIALRVAVSGGYAYVADCSAGLQLIAISNPAAPIRVGGYMTSGWAMDVAVSGRYDYVACQYDGLVILRAGIPLAPAITITTHSPVDIIVTDPNGFQISKQLNEIQGATYLEYDINGDGHLEDEVIIPYRKIGNYLVTVLPEPNTLPTDTYSLETTIDDQTMIVAQDTQIQDIPPEPYKFESKLNWSDFDSDGDADYADLDKISYHWLSQDCNYPDWCEGADLNYSHFVDLIDITLFAEHWLEGSK
jgi:hypothetical protein